MQRFLFVFMFIVCGVFSSLGQTFGLTFEQLEARQKIATRPIVIFLHAEWCKYCEKMKNTTFQDEEVRNLLEKNFYLVSFDGEQKTDVIFLGKTFKFKPSGNGTGTHELAEQLAAKDGRVSYPSLVFLNDKYEILYVHSEFVSSKQMRKLLNDWINAVGQ